MKTHHAGPNVGERDRKVRKQYHKNADKTVKADLLEKFD